METGQREILEARIQQLREALETLCSACISRNVPRIIQACRAGLNLLEETKEKITVQL